jgi:Tol biopolymer transport system component
MLGSRRSIASAAVVAAVLALAAFSSAASATFPGANGPIAYGTWALQQRIHTVMPDGTGDQIVATGTFPAWSPSGGRIAFIRQRSQFKAGVPEATLFITGAHGGNPRPLASAGVNAAYSPSFSPSGARVTFTHGDKSGDDHVFTIRTDGSDERKIAPGTFPVYSPVDRLIAYLDFRPGLWTMRADGTHKRRLVPRFRTAIPVDFSPDGQTILFLHETGRTAIPYTVPMTGGPPQRLGPCTGYDPRFSPDGKELVSYHDHQGSDGRFFSTLDVTAADGSCPVTHVLRTRAVNGIAWQPVGTG